MTASFFAIILFSILLVFLSKLGHSRQGAKEFFVASGQFGAVLFFFLSVGETYSITSMLGFPGGVYSKGDAFVAWFFSYILLAAPLIYLVGPLIWRAGALYDCATIPDFFRSHFGSRALELVIAWSAILLLVPVGTTQFLGFRIVFEALGLPIPPLVTTGFAGLLVFLYVYVSGLRAAAFVAILKDVLMMAAILAVGGLAILHWHITGPATAATAPVTAPTRHDLVFAISTMILQAAGYLVIPQTWAFLFSARSASTIRRAQVVAPLYMVMFPLLMCVAYFAKSHSILPPLPDFVFITTAQALLPDWLVGVVLAAIALSGLVLLSSVCLAIGPLFTRNVVSGLGGAAQQRWALVVIACYLALSVVGTETSVKMMATLTNVYYFGISQLLPGLFAAFCLPRVRAEAIIAGMLTGFTATAIVFIHPDDLGGLNAGLIGLLVNIPTMLFVARIVPRIGARTVLDQLKSLPAGKQA